MQNSQEAFAVLSSGYKAGARLSCIRYFSCPLSLGSVNFSSAELFRMNTIVRTCFEEYKSTGNEVFFLFPLYLNRRIFSTGIKCFVKFVLIIKSEFCLERKSQVKNPFLFPPQID